MKKILNILLIFVISIFLTSQAFANYYPIPKDKSKKYRAEINREIEKQYPKVIKQINKVEDEIINEKDPYVKLTILDNGVDGVLFDFYEVLIDITEKYTKIYVPPTDFSGALSEALTQHFIDNRINTSKIKALKKYANKKQKEYKKKYFYSI